MNEHWSMWVRGGAGRPVTRSLLLQSRLEAMVAWTSVRALKKINFLSTCPPASALIVASSLGILLEMFHVET